MTDNAKNPEKSADQTPETPTPNSAEMPESNSTTENQVNGSSPGSDQGDAPAESSLTGAEAPAESPSTDQGAEPAEGTDVEAADATASASGTPEVTGGSTSSASPTDPGTTSGGEGTSSVDASSGTPPDTPSDPGAESATPAAASGGESPVKPEKSAEEIEAERKAAEEKAAAEKAALEAMRPVWEELAAKKDSRETFEGTVTGVNRGGVVAEYQGIEVFIPQSHWSVDRSADVDPSIVGIPFEMNVLEITQFDTDARRVTGTRRSLLRKELLASLEPGMKINGKVSTLTDFGAFVDIGGVDGLLHVSEISHARSAQPKDLLKKGEEIEVVVKKIEKGGKRISLGRKELLDSPWKGVAERYAPDSIVSGTVVSLTDIGAFVQLEPGVDGLIRPRELSWTKRVHSASDMLKVGDKVEVMVLSVNEEDERIGLSLKRAGENPWPEIVEKFSDEEKTWEATVREVSNKGAVVSVDEIEGFLPRGRMGRESNRLTELKAGDKLTVRVVEVDTKRPSVIFGLPMSGGGGGRSGGAGGGGERRGGGGGGGRGRGGRDFQATPATPSNEMKSAETVSNFSLGDMLAEVMKEKLGIEEREAEAKGGNPAKSQGESTSEPPKEEKEENVSLDPKDVPVVTADPSSDTVNAPLSSAEFGVVDGGDGEAEQSVTEEQASTGKPSEEAESTSPDTPSPEASSDETPEETDSDEEKPQDSASDSPST